MESAAATSPWLPPGGSCHDEISASRNRYFVVTDEGRRWLKVLDFPVKWRKPEHIPLIQLHSFTNLSPPLISLATLSSFPPGEVKGQLREPVPFNALLCSIRKWAAAPLGSPSWRPLRTQKILACSNQCTTPPQPEVEPRRLCRNGRLRASPTDSEAFGLFATNAERFPCTALLTEKPLRLTFVQHLPFQGRQGHFVPACSECEI